MHPVHGTIDASLMIAKGTVTQFSGPGRAHCGHEWKEIESDEFKQVATAKYHVRWIGSQYWKPNPDPTKEFARRSELSN
jgi:hypothetical protein